MPREIKFRGRQLDTGRWIYGYYLKTPLTSEVMNTNIKDGWSLLCGKERHCIAQDNCVFEIIPESVGEYTGFKDKKGNKIEGDIVNCGEYECCGKISFDEDSAAFMFEILEDGGSFEDEWLYEYADELEVVGNIYENPELLEG